LHSTEVTAESRGCREESSCSASSAESAALLMLGCREKTCSQETAERLALTAGRGREGEREREREEGDTMQLLNLKHVRLR